MSVAAASVLTGPPPSLRNVLLEATTPKPEQHDQRLSDEVAPRTAPRIAASVVAATETCETCSTAIRSPTSSTDSTHATLEARVQKLLTSFSSRQPLPFPGVARKSGIVDASAAYNGRAPFIATGESVVGSSAPRSCDRANPSDKGSCCNGNLAPRSAGPSATSTAASLRSAATGGSDYRRLRNEDATREVVLRSHEQPARICAGRSTSARTVPQVPRPRSTRATATRATPSAAAPGGVQTCAPTRPRSNALRPEQSRVVSSSLLPPELVDLQHSRSAAAYGLTSKPASGRGTGTHGATRVVMQPFDATERGQASASDATQQPVATTSHASTASSKRNSEVSPYRRLVAAPGARHQCGIRGYLSPSVRQVCPSVNCSLPAQELPHTPELPAWYLNSSPDTARKFCNRDAKLTSGPNSKLHIWDSNTVVQSGINRNFTAPPPAAPDLTNPVPSMAQNSPMFGSVAMSSAAPLKNYYRRALPTYGSMPPGANNNNSSNLDLYGTEITPSAAPHSANVMQLYNPAVGAGIGGFANSDILRLSPPTARYYSGYPSGLKQSFNGAMNYSSHQGGVPIAIPRDPRELYDFDEYGDQFVYDDGLDNVSNVSHLSRSVSYFNFPHWKRKLEEGTPDLSVLFPDWRSRKQSFERQRTAPYRKRNFCGC